MQVLLHLLYLKTSFITIDGLKTLTLGLDCYFFGVQCMWGFALSSRYLLLQGLLAVR